LLHGDPASAYTWRKIIEPLSKRYRGHAIDLPGYGFSEKPARASYDTAWLARIVTLYLDTAGVERAALVGNSMGGYVASETAILFPARVDALVLLAAAGLDLENAEAADLPLSMRIATMPVIGPVVRALPARAVVADALSKSVFDPSSITDEDVDAYYLPLRTKNGLAAFLRRSNQRVEPDRRDLVASIRVPTLVITGDTDRVVPPAVARAYDELIPDSRLVVLERTGHMPQEEQPQRTVEEIVAFLEAGAG
jgi:pimeloyl-ACP methyl ester carboxylesterase